ncbi:hypothetical protein MASR1M65_04640 [Saprospiraceae bacterium]
MPKTAKRHLRSRPKIGIGAGIGKAPLPTEEGHGRGKWTGARVSAIGAGSPRYAFRIEYHGGPFCGWQRQAGGLPSVQQAVEEALARLEPGEHRIAAAGRTDAGVHATGQVAHADLAKAWSRSACRRRRTGT